MPPARRTAQPQAPGSTQAPTQSQWQAPSQSQQPTRARARPPSRPASRNEPTAPTTAVPSSMPATQQAGAAPVRRNLFSSTLSRRPQPTSSETTAGSGAAGSNRVSSMPVGAGSSNVASGSGFTPVASSSAFGGGNPVAGQTGSPGPLFRGTSHGGTETHTFTRGPTRKDDILDEDDDILVPEPADAKGKKAALEKELLIRNLEEANLAAASSAACANAGDGVVVLDDAPEMDEKERSARLIELYRSHARQRIDPIELKAAVQESLRRKIASIEEDKWMYEAESDSEES